MNFFEKKAKEGKSPVNQLIKSSGWSQCGLIPHYSKVRFFRTTLLNLVTALLITKNIQSYINMYIYLSKLQLRTKYRHTLYMEYVANDFIKINKINFFKSIPFFKLILPKQGTTKLLYFLANAFSLGINALFMDYNYNYNYLPLSNDIIFSRSAKTFSKTIKYFNIGIILYFDLSNKKFIFKKASNQKLMNISLTNKTDSKKFDLNLNFCNTKISNYMIYLLVINTYLKVRC